MKPRHEYKHIINLCDLMQLRSRLKTVLKRDLHADDTGKYLVKTLYFDNYMDKALKEKFDGVSYREKFRIRYYNSDTDFIRLEKKSKKGGLCYKESVPITKKDCEKLLKGDISFLINSENDLLKELYAKMHYQMLRPKCIVAYTRESFICAQGNTRVTLDSNISGSNNVLEFLNPSLSFTKLFNNSVLEVKWDEYLPQLVKDIVQMKNGRKSTAFSKYAAVRFF